MNGPRIVSLDIETRPALGWIWGMWDQNIGLSQLKEASEVMAVGWKVLGENVVQYVTEWADTHDGMIETVWKVLDQTDILVTYNGKKFDVRHLNREFMKQGLGPPSPYKHIDLLRSIKQVAVFQSHKLEHISQELVGAGKVKHEGFELWLKCMAGDTAARKRMVRYMQQDVRLNEKVYLKIRGWIPNHPHMGLWQDTAELRCVNCGSSDLMRQGVAHTAFQTYQRYQCRKCRKWNRGNRIVGRVGGSREDRG